MAQQMHVQSADQVDSGLRSITVPIVTADIETGLHKTFRLWSDPRFSPARTARVPGQQLIVVVNNANPAQLARVSEIYAEFPGLTTVFQGLDVVSADLAGERDLYVRDGKTLVGRFGNKAGPNFLFQAAMKAARPHGGFTFQMELDCLPVGSDWLAALETVVRANARAWVIGTIFSGDLGLSKSIQGHLNGNALYKAGDPGFQDFLDNHWMPGILRMAQKNPAIAYDIWWALETMAADPAKGNEAWWRVQKYDSFFRNDPFLMNLRGGAATFDIIRRRCAEMRMLDRSPIFVHSASMNKVLDLLLCRPDLDMLGAMDWLAFDPAEHQDLRNGLMAMQGRICAVSVISHLLTQPRIILPLLEDDRELASHVDAALQDASAQRLRDHYRRVRRLAAARLQFGAKR